MRRTFSQNPRLPATVAFTTLVALVALAAAAEAALPDRARVSAVRQIVNLDGPRPAKSLGDRLADHLTEAARELLGAKSPVAPPVVGRPVALALPEQDLPARANGLEAHAPPSLRILAQHLDLPPPLV